VKCKVCSSEFISPANNPHKMYCCNACKVKAFKQIKDPMFGNRREASRIAMGARAAAALHEKLMAAERKLSKQRATWARACHQCEAAFSALDGRAMKYCGSECTREAAKEQKRAARIAGKAIKRAATIEAVSPLRVFRRDGWACYLCGIHTPEALRGTYEPNAPELEHVTPLSRGGEHSYANTRCACRACNLIKGDRTLEEVGGAYQGPGGGVLVF